MTVQVRKSAANHQHDTDLLVFGGAGGQVGSPGLYGEQRSFTCWITRAEAMALAQHALISDYNFEAWSKPQEYFSSGWNVFDCMVVLLSLLEIFLASATTNLSALR